MKMLVASMACVGALLGASSGFAQSFPARPIQLIVPFAPGGATDLIARRIGKEMSESLGQPVVVDNRAGASGAIGSTMVANAKPDGYTLLLGVTTTHGINPVLGGKLRYDPVADFSPVSLVATMPIVLVVNGASPARSLDEFIRLAKRSKPSMSFGSAGEGSPQHLAGEMMKSMFGFDAVHVPYKGGGPALNDLISGQIQFVSAQLAEAKPFIQAGRLRALAVAAEQRVPGFDVPTFAESGHPLTLTAWYAVFGPAGMPADVVAALNTAIVKAVRVDAVREAFANLDVTPVGSSSAELAGHVKRELALWREAVRKAGLRPPE